MCNCAAANYKSVLNWLNLVVDFGEEILCPLGRGDYGDDVTLCKYEITVCDISIVITLDGAEGNVGLQLCGYFLYRHSCKTAVFGKLKGEKVHASLGKGVDLKSRGKVQDSGDLSCGRKLGVDDHCKSKLVLEVGSIHIVFGISESGNSATACRFFCYKTGEQIKLVVACNSYKKIGVVNARLLLYRS